MSYQENVGRTPSAEMDDRTVSQMVFVAVGLAIVVGGLWLLYQGNAPYHPDVPMTDSETYLAIES
ncbi:hypothetical protein JQV27_10845 [Sulfitobacter mediterraneus]|jgi:hypothetical protein|uniref:hypothetical protein n=1 Tax=Sulfitobacter TaxID=60136 RepID=UPI001932EE24|nr:MULTISPECIES: hypothetical protein [Sulfitobacter]MBM1632739.1 hypothetical protein [Sulfitobacter mediterraneus]MBM1641127.1 hypothetical protein [Sulfitobacter mediterraneus]MBM1644604.1 hypothetical protein [Sulfitobacter mediterraneus]MBM1649247.1 hypothetical protein [Sulfitobacter mediterraneus]MBM1653268.1 hypothetical protein [Sulfitobacter mediterraneus]